MIATLRRMLQPTKEQRQMWQSAVPITPNTVARLLYWQRLLQQTRSLPGVIVECGIGCGNSLVMLASLTRAMQMHQPIIAFDSFQGLPVSSEEDGTYQRGREGMLAYPLSYIQALLSTPIGVRHGIQLRAGWFQDTLVDDLPWIALLHLDCDLYESYRVCLERLTPHLLPGAIVAVDEYANESLRWPGAQTAIDAWCAIQNWTVRTDAATGKCFILVP